jgi:hypothetical protein
LEGADFTLYLLAADATDGTAMTGRAGFLGCGFAFAASFRTMR